MVGLIERKRNFAAPSTIYVKLPNGRNNDQLTAEKQAERKAGKPDEREPENRLTDSRKTGPCTAGKPDVLYKEGTTVLNYRSSSKAATAASRTDSDRDCTALPAGDRRLPTFSTGQAPKLP